MLALLVATAPALDADAGDTGIVRGRVRFEGPPPAPASLYMTLDPACDRLYPKGRPSDSLLVDPSGGLANVLVHVKSGLPGKTRWATPDEAVRIEQKGCMFVPHVIAVRAGQEIDLHNSDPSFYNVSARANSNPSFRVAMPGRGASVRRSFASPEVAVKLKCDVHPWMSAFVGVFDHPFFAVSAADGSFVLPPLPEGDYTIEAWHETLGIRSSRIEVEEDETATVEFSFAGN